MNLFGALALRCLTKEVGFNILTLCEATNSFRRRKVVWHSNWADSTERIEGQRSHCMSTLWDLTRTASFMKNVFANTKVSGSTWCVPHFRSCLFVILTTAGMMSKIRIINISAFVVSCKCV